MPNFADGHQPTREDAPASGCVLLVSWQTRQQAPTADHVWRVRSRAGKINNDSWSWHVERLA